MVYDKYTPHINLYINSFKTKYKTVSPLFTKHKVPNKIPKSGDYLVLISEFAEYCDVHGFLKNEINRNTSTIKSILFQVIFTLAVLNKKYPGFRHNDLSPANCTCSKNIKSTRTYFL